MIGRYAVFLILLLVPSADACTLCDPSMMKLQTLRQEARSARRVVVGTLANARLEGERGFTDLRVERLLKGDPLPENNKTLVIERWMPLDPKKPKRVMVFYDFYEGRWDAYRGVDLKGNAVDAYLANALLIADSERDRQLLYYFEFLDHPDATVASDAFLEFAKADDAEIVRIARKLDRRKLRSMFDDAKTPPERLGLYGYLLAAAGTNEDYQYLFKQVQNPDDRIRMGLSGILGGLIEARPAEGWEVTYRMFQKTRPIADRLAAMGAVRFQQSVRFKESTQPILACMKAIVSLGDMADMAIEDLRRWRRWDLTADILAVYDRPTHQAPLVRNAVVRYALSCADRDSQIFLQRVQKEDPSLLKEMQEALQYERPRKE